MPGWVKVNWKDAPFASVGDVNDKGAPESVTTVCDAPSSFTQATVVPAFTVNVEGLNAKSFRVIVSGSPVPEGLVGAGVTEPGLNEHPAQQQAKISRNVPRVRNRTGERVVIVPD